MATDNTTTTTTTPLASNEHVDTRDFRVLSIALIGADGKTREIAPMVPEIQIRQDMYMGFMTGEMMVRDGVDLIAQHQIHGGEYIFLHIAVPEQKIELKKAFRIYKIGKRIPVENSQKYTIYFMSDELFTSHTLKISKAYTNSTTSSIVFDILKNILKIDEKRIFIDDTDTPSTTIIPVMRPLEALNWLASRAYTDKLSTFFFYENFNGFHFKSLNSIYKSPTVIKVPFTFENKKALKDLDMDKFAIDEMEARRDFDTLSTIASGGYAMRLNSLNVVSRSIFTNDYRLDSSITKLYDNSPMSNGGDIFNKPNAHVLTYLDGFGIERYVIRVMALAALNSNLVEVVVPGNMGLNVGTLVSIRVPYSVIPASGDMWDKQKSGKYLLFAVNHKFDMVSHMFTSLAFIARDSQPESLPSSDITLPDKIRKINNG